MAMENAKLKKFQLLLKYKMSRIQVNGKKKWLTTIFCTMALIRALEKSGVELK